MLLFLAILLGLPSFLGVFYLLLLRARGKKAVKVDEEAVTEEDGLMKVNRLKKGNRAPVQDNLCVIPESEEELIINVITTAGLHHAEDSTDSDDEEFVLHHGVFSI